MREKSVTRGSQNLTQSNAIFDTGKENIPRLTSYERDLARDGWNKMMEEFVDDLKERMTHSNWMDELTELR